VARSGSFSTAAGELGYTQSVVSHHVAALESELGVTLVNRGTRPVSITDAGQRLLRHTEAALGHIAAAEDELRARRRMLRLTDLAGERFTAPPGGGFYPYRQVLDRLCADAGFEPNVAHEVDDVRIARAFVAAGLGVAVLPELALPPPHEDVAVRPVRDVQPFRSICATWLRGRRVPAVVEVVGYLAETAGARLG
jgi:DNA-binding transcriptional LysR family regulator